MTCLYWPSKLQKITTLHDVDIRKFAHYTLATSHWHPPVKASFLYTSINAHPSHQLWHDGSRLSCRCTSNRLPAYNSARLVYFVLYSCRFSLWQVVSYLASVYHMIIINYIKAYATTVNHCIIIAGAVNGCHEPQKFKIPGLIYSLIILQMYNIIQNRGCQPRRSKWNILARTNHDLYSGSLAGHLTIITHHNNIDYLNFSVFYNYDLCYNTVALFCLQCLSMFLIITSVCVIGCKDTRGPSECSRK